MNDDAREGDEVGARWPELAVALVLMVLAVLVITDSIRVGIGWADDGPRSGYFPFYIGLAMFVSAGWIAVSQLMRWKRHEGFATRAQLSLVWAMLWPAVVYVGLIALLGIYLASALLIGYFMRRHGRHGVALTGAVSLGVPLTFFLIFERWFLVPLPKGPLESLLGL